MKKIVHTVVDVAIANGQKTNDLTTPRLKAGKVVSVAFYPFSEPTSNVNVIIEKASSGEEIHPSITYKNYMPNSGGGYEASFKPLVTKGGENIEIKMTAKENLTAEFKGQFIFNIEQEIEN